LIIPCIEFLYIEPNDPDDGTSKLLPSTMYTRPELKMKDFVKTSPGRAMMTSIVSEPHYHYEKIPSL